MQIDFIVVGQGLCGSWLSHFLQEANASFVVVDEAQPFTASKMASGVINPVTGRRIVKTWMIDDLMPFAWNAYQLLGKELGISCIAETSIIDCFATPQMRIAFTERFEKDQQYLSLPADQYDWLSYLQYDFGYGIVKPAYLIDIVLLLERQRKRLADAGQLAEEHFDFSKLRLEQAGVIYKDLHAEKIIFCDGAAGYHNLLFPNLPYGLNKGEMLLVQIPDFPTGDVIKKGYSLVPWSGDIFWLGSTYLWEFADERPTAGFYQFAENWLRQTIKLPFTIVDHRAAVRPATLERKPFVGLHPLYERVGILNGMGTKGCSLAPFFARQLTNHLLLNTPIQPDADVQRFKKALSR